LPELLVFAPCQKVLIDQNNSASLITVLETLNIVVPAAQLPEGVIVPVNWEIFTLWSREVDEGGDRDFEQVCELFAANGVLLQQWRMTFRIEKQAHRVIHRNPGFPLKGSGQYLLHLSLREPDGKISEVAAYPLTVTVGLREDDPQSS
jgi:hypothetical protein